jgi:hypothetical protein
VPGPRRSGAGRQQRGGTHVVGTDDVDDRVRTGRRGEPPPDPLRIHQRGIPEHARRPHRVAGGQSQRDVEVAVLEIELARPQELVGIPPPDVVIDRHPRIPLRYLIEPAFGIVLAAGTAAERNRVVPRDRDRGHRLGRKRPVEIDAHHGAVHPPGEGSLGGLPARACPHRRNPLDGGAEEDTRLRPESREVQHRESGRLRPLVHVELKPDEAQGVRGVVGVPDGLRPLNHVGRGVQGGANGVIRPLLPVSRPRETGGSPVDVWRCQIEDPEGRGVRLAASILRERLLGRHREDMQKGGGQEGADGERAHRSPE